MLWCFFPFPYNSNSREKEVVNHTGECTVNNFSFSVSFRKINGKMQKYLLLQNPRTWFWFWPAQQYRAINFIPKWRSLINIDKVGPIKGRQKH